MMTVADTSELPKGVYVRCDLALDQITHGQTGENYRRADGECWPEEGYQVFEKSDGSRECVTKVRKISGD